MKDYLCYQMMAYYGVDSPLCSFVYITVNGEDWGLYLAVEGIEDAFLERNYGADYGNLYKPDSQSNGVGANEEAGGRDNANMDKNMDGNMGGNVDEVIRYFVVHNFTCNFDSYTGSMIHNYYLTVEILKK